MNFVKINNKKEWSELLDKSLFKTFFHSLGWENFLEQQFKWLKFQHYVYKDESLLSLAQHKNKLISHPFCEYGGILPLDAGKEIDIKQFQQDLFSEFDKQIKISFHPKFLSFLKPLPSRDYKKRAEALQFHYLNFSQSGTANSQRQTYFIQDFDKKTENEIWRNLRKSIKQEIKKAQNQNYDLKQCENEQELKEFFHLYLLKAKEHKIPAYPYSFFQYFSRNSDAEIILAKTKNKVAAGSVFLFYEKCVHYFVNASDRLNIGANHLILWSQIQKYIGKNFSIFDLGGSRKGTKLEIFKSGWSAVPLPILEIKNYPDSLLRNMDLLRNIWGVLPVSLIRILSPYFLKYKH